MARDRPSGTVTFLFTDIEGSTRRWEADQEEMRAALVAHDEVLRVAISDHRGRMFKHTGDGVCAVFESARDAIEAAVAAQRGLVLPVRMGIATGEAEVRNGDYFGPVLNRTARIMAAGHGGQVLLSAVTAGLVDGVDVLDLGDHRLKDLAGTTRLFQVRAPGLVERFPSLRTLDAVAGNLPVLTTSFVGRDLEVKDLVELLRSQRLVTLTGVGGVGKTRLSVEAAAELSGEFCDGVWLVELASVPGPPAVADAAAAVLGVTVGSGRPVRDQIAEALAGRQVLVVLDNCEHVLDAVGDLAEAILTRSATATVLATSREALGLPAEHRWPVQPLAVEGPGSPAVALFVERARAVGGRCRLDDPSDEAAVVEICRRLDGLALAIELAAARTVSMTPQDVRDRLGDRFRLLSGARRGLERHQTLRAAVGWSYDLLDETERAVLDACSVFADGFDLAATSRVCADDGLDEYAVLDVLDPLVRKSLVTVDQVGGHARYSLLETIRQFAADRLVAAGTAEAVRRRHAAYFAEVVQAQWALAHGTRLRDALDWLDREFANLRTAFRFAADAGELVTAATIAAHTAMLGHVLQRFEPVGWAEELLAPARAVDLPQLPRLYTAASFCAYTGRPDEAVAHLEAALALERDDRYDSFEQGWSAFRLSSAHAYAGRPERCLEINEELTTRSGYARLMGLCGVLVIAAAAGQPERATRIAEAALAEVRASGSPYLLTLALYGYGRAMAATDPRSALESLHEGLELAREHRVVYREARLAREAAALEATLGHRNDALDLFERTIDRQHRAGEHTTLGVTLGNLVVMFDRLARYEVAATVLGTTTDRASTRMVVELPAVIDHLRAVLGEADFAGLLRTGSTMDASEAICYVRDQLRLAREEAEPA